MSQVCNLFDIEISMNTQENLASPGRIEVWDSADYCNVFDTDASRT